MTVTERQHKTVVILDLSGDIVIGEGEVELRERVNALLENKQRHILLNFANVTRVDSAGVGELVACYKRTTAANGALKLLNLPEPVSDLLRLTRLRELFEIHDNEEQALAAF